VDGRVVLEINQGIGRADSHWIYFIFLCIIFICFKVGIIILTYLPWEQMQFKIKAFFPVDKASTFISVKRTFIELNEEDVSVDLEPSREDVRIVIHHLNKATHKDVKLSIAPRSSFQHTHHPYLTWTGLSVTLPRGKVLINNVSGHIQVGKVLALMGPSGDFILFTHHPF
jgi:ABC-type multidrug transport system fused ATPase/permease subunit